MRLRPVFVALLVLATGAWRRHPIHAARVELDVAANGFIAATVHVYRDDLPPGAAIAEVSPVLDRGLTLTDSRGDHVALRVQSVVAEGDRLRISLSGTTSHGVSHGRIAVTLLQERFTDQVNVLDVRTPGGQAQLVFLCGDRPQPLP